MRRWWTVAALCVAGVLWVGAGGGLYWLVVGLLFLLMNGIAIAWILLVEILR